MRRLTRMARLDVNSVMPGPSLRRISSAALEELPFGPVRRGGLPGTMHP
jgi:hypothetical protein